ncbi:MAG: HYR domain-containing protein [Flavobacteriales bacterium]|nr:HYR domain-containing protein [Flavobacteriales bacterium]
MKKLYTLLIALIAFGGLNAQTVTYDITMAGISPSDCPGCNCSGTGEWYLGSPLILGWTSTGTFTPTSVTLEVYEVSNDAGSGILVNFNSIPDGNYGVINSCVSTVISIPLTPANYNVGSTNAVEIDYNAAFALYEIDENPAWGSGVYARVVVVYPTAPVAPIAVVDFATVTGGTTGNIIDVQANDSDANGDVLITTILSGPTSGGSVTILNGDSLSYDPPASFCGIDTIVYQVCDPGPLCDFDTLFITVTDGAAPTAVCQPVTVYLDATGSASIVAADVDGGSTDNCSSVTLSADITTFTCSDLSSGPMYDLIITGAYDGPLSGGTPKGIELYVLNNIADLSQYGVGSANNGGGTDGEEFTFPAVSASAGQFIYIASDSAQFNNWFGFFPDYKDFSMSINGDDAIELFYLGSAIDVFGDINVDGTGQPWDYVDGWAYSNNSRAQSTTFNIANWTYSGADALDGETTNGSATAPVPVGTYTSSGLTAVSVTLTVQDADLNTSTCTGMVTVLDSLAPSFSGCPSNMSVTATIAGCSAAVTWTAPVENDNCGGVTVVSSHNSGDTLALGTTTITYTATDASGNTSDCSFDVTVSSALAATSTVTDALCNGDSTGTAAVSGTGNVGPVVFDFGTLSQTALPAGVHYYTVTDSIGCMVTDSVTITEPTAISLSVIATDETNSSGNGGTDLTVSGGVAGYAFDWDNDGTGDFDDLEDLSSLSTGTYSVIVMDANGCTDTISVFVDNVVGLLESDNEFGVQIYPNPSNGQFVLEVLNASQISIEVIDILGKRIEFISNAGTRTNMDLGNAQAGVYLGRSLLEIVLLLKELLLESKSKL